MKKISANFAQKNLNKIMDCANEEKQDIAILHNKKNIIMISEKKYKELENQINNLSK